MSILGIGVDIVENKRIKKLLSIKKNKFCDRIFTKKENIHCNKKKNFICCYAKRFAAKEALVKAIGIGFRKNINFKDIEIINNFHGKPNFVLKNNISQKIKSIFKVKKFVVFLSVADEKEYSIANVVIFKK